MRRQLPVHSPMSLRSLGAGLLGTFQKTTSDSLEALIRREWAASDVLLTDSGTTALGLAISVACSRTGLVGLPAFACYDLATAADAAGVRVVLYDVDPQTLTPDPESLARALRAGADAVVVVHLYGIPVDMDAVAREAAAAGAVVIEDAAQGFGAVMHGQRAGSFGRYGILSFGRGKGLSAGGGGALLVRDQTDARALEQLRATGMAAPSRGAGEWLRASAQWLLARPSLYSLPASLPFLRLGETIYHPAHAARGMSAGARRMLLSNWQRSSEEASVRHANAARLRVATDAGNIANNILVRADSTPGYLRLPALLTADRQRLLTGDTQRLGVMPSYPMPLSELPGFSLRCTNAQQGFPGARTLATSLITLPTHSLLSSRDLESLEAWLRSAP